MLSNAAKRACARLTLRVVNALLTRILVRVFLSGTVHNIIML